MPDPQLQQWRGRGVVAVWGYKSPPRGYAGWHVGVDDEGIRSLIELFELLKVANYTPSKAFRVLHPGPSLLSLVGITRPIIEFEELRIKLDRELDERWEFSTVSPALVVTLGLSSLREFSAALAKALPDTLGDISVKGISGPPLWIWKATPRASGE